MLIFKIYLSMQLEQFMPLKAIKEFINKAALYFDEFHKHLMLSICFYFRMKSPNVC